MSEGWLERLIEEYDQVNERYRKLTDFVAGKTFDDLPREDQKLLWEQHHYMRRYLDVLMQRKQKAPVV